MLADLGPGAGLVVLGGGDGALGAAVQDAAPAAREAVGLVLEEGIELVLHVGVALGVQGTDDGVGADDLVLLVAGVELPSRHQSALDGQGAQVAFELGLEPRGVVDEIASAVGDAALDTVDADDPVGHQHMAVQVRVQGP